MVMTADCTSTPNTLAPPDDPRYFPPHFSAALSSVNCAGGTDSYRSYMRSEIERGREIVRILQPWTTIHGRDVLDVGCGYGGLLIVMHEAGASAISGIEVDKHRLGWAKERLASLRYPANLQQLDICSPEATKGLGAYDLILAQDVIEHVSDPSVTIRHLSELLRPGGVVYMQVGNKFSPDQLHGDHHYKLPGITLLSRPQAMEYWRARFGLDPRDYAVGVWREEKYYRNVFKLHGVHLERIDKYPSTDHVLWYAKSISEMCAKLEGNLWPDLRPDLARRMSRRMRKIAQLYVHACRQLPRFADNPGLLAQACDAIAARLLSGVWRLVGVKQGQPENHNGHKRKD